MTEPKIVDPTCDTGLVVTTRPFVVETVVFLAGAVVMILELVGSRLLAPYFGNSLLVWTSLIGIVLLFIAVGNFLGGRLGDRHLSVSVLFWILAGASASISLIAFLEGFIIPLLARGDAVALASVGASVVLFAIPAVVLGMVSPYCIRLKMHAIADSGATVGSLYALSTLGSIVGTFLAGFWLIAIMGSHGILGWLAAVPLALSLLFVTPINARRGIGFALALALLLGAVLFTRSSIETFDTPYDRYMIGEETEASSLRPVRTLVRDFESIESAVYADNGEPYIMDYYRYYDAALAAAPSVDRTLLIGGGTFVYPRHQLAQYPDSTTDVVEIDPVLVDVARESFWLEEDPRLSISVEDGRTFLNDATGPYDVVLIDAFKSANSIPYQLTTYESMKRAYDVLDDDGVLAMNTIASASGAGSRFLWAEYVTLKELFPQVEVYAAYDLEDASAVQNIAIIASKSETVDLAKTVERVAPELAKQRIVKPQLPQGIGVITDDFAPVDQYLMGI